MRRHERRRRARALAAIATLLTAGAAAAQAPALRPAATDPDAAQPSTSASTPQQPGASFSADAPASASRRPATTVTRGRDATAAFAPPAASLAASGLDGGGDAAPLCRAACAPAFYTCVSGGGDTTCHAGLATCRRGCDAAAPPAGRLQSPLPAAGLAPVGALRPLPGGLPSPQ